MLLQMQWQRLTIKLTLTDRFSVIRGDSGTYKSLLVDKLFNPDDMTTVSCNMNYQQLPINALINVQGMHDTLIVADDALFFKSAKRRAKFQELVNTYCVSNNLYFLIIERSTVDFYSLSYDIHSIFELVEESHNVIVNKEMYSFLDDTGMSRIVITEDTTDGYMFARKIFTSVPVIPSRNGKSTFSKAIESYTNFVALIDTFAFGCHAQEFADRRKFDHRTLFYNVGSIEKILCDLYSPDVSFIETNFSKEKSYESALGDLPETYRLRTVHGKEHSRCLYSNCNSCTDRLSGLCGEEWSGNNLIKLLDRNGYNNLTKYHAKENKVPVQYTLPFACAYCLTQSTEVVITRNAMCWSELADKDSYVLTYNKKFKIFVRVLSESIFLIAITDLTYSELQNYIKGTISV